MTNISDNPKNNIIDFSSHVRNTLVKKELSAVYFLLFLNDMFNQNEKFFRKNI